MNIKEKIKKLPHSPGVYLMKDSLDNIIYVGKSKNSKNRVGSYFINSKAHSSKVIKLVQNLKDFDYILTDTEFEALLLECKLIKEIKPRYNRLMKNPKGNCYIKIKMDEKYPSIEISSEANSSDGNLYFGPYTNKNSVERGLCGIKEHSKILCNNSSPKALGCLKYSMNLCIGMCTANPSEEDYFYLVERVIKLLQGIDFTILAEMEHEMNIALIDSLNDEEIKFFLIRYNKLLFSERYKLKNFSNDDIKNKVKSNIISHFNDTLKDSINIDKDEIDEAHIIYNYIKRKENTCKYLVITQQWINDMDNFNIGIAVDEFFERL